MASQANESKSFRMDLVGAGVSAVILLGFTISGLILIGYAAVMGWPLLSELTISDIFNAGIAPISVVAVVAVIAILYGVTAGLVSAFFSETTWRIRRLFVRSTKQSHPTANAQRENEADDANSRDRIKVSRVILTVLFCILFLLFSGWAALYFGISILDLDFSHRSVGGSFTRISVHSFFLIVVWIIIFRYTILYSNLAAGLLVFAAGSLIALGVGSFLAGKDLVDAQKPCMRWLSDRNAPLCVVKNLDRGYLTYEGTSHEVKFVADGGQRVTMIHENKTIPVWVSGLTPVHRRLRDVALWANDLLEDSSILGFAAVERPGRAGLTDRIQKSPNDGDLHRRRGLVNVRLGQLDQAITDFTRALELTPNDSEALTWRAFAFYLKEDFERSIQDYSHSFRIKAPEAYQLSDRGEAFSKLGKLDEAIADFSAAIALKPKNGTHWVRRAYAHGSRGDFKAALDDVAMATELNPGASGYWLNRCEINVLFGELRELNSVLADCGRSDDSWPLAVRGLAHFKLGDISVALAEFEAALKREPGYAVALYGRGSVKRARGDLAGAEADIAAAKAADAELVAKVERWLASEPVKREPPILDKLSAFPGGEGTVRRVVGIRGGAIFG